MTATTDVQARVPVELNNDTDAMFSSMGMDTATGIRKFLAQVRLHNGLPFAVSADPFWSAVNQTRLRESIRQIREGNVVHHELIEDDDD